MSAVTELAIDVSTCEARQVLWMPPLLREKCAVGRPLPPERPRGLRRHAHSTRRNGKWSWLVYTKNVSRIVLPPLFMRRCSMKASITARFAPCIACSDEHGEVRERRDQLTHPPYQKPELMATASESIVELGYNQATGPREVELFLLVRAPRCVQPLRHRLDGRLSRKRRAGQRLIEESCKKQNIQPGQLTLHADRGTSMRSKPVALLLADLGVTKTHSRPHVRTTIPFPKANSEP